MKKIMTAMVCAGSFVLSPLVAGPLDPAVKGEPMNYASAFEGYKADEDFEPSGWKDANDRVGEIGGWRTYLREATEPKASPKGGKP